MSFFEQGLISFAANCKGRPAMQTPEVQEIEDAIAAAMIAISELRVKGARVHCITNTVAQNFTANVLLACGATPSMTVSPEEAALFTSRSDALLINLGTLSDDRKNAIMASCAAASSAGVPVVLDPVMCHVSPPRLAFAAELLTESPDILRANSDEINAIEAAGVPVTQMCRVLTGKVDRICHDATEWKVENGHVWMSRITAVGCAQGGLLAALASRTDSPQIASLAALLWTNIAGEIAVENATGPGSFQPAYIDALHSVSLPEIGRRTRVS
jgi:hydroxyethylthiazole kinase